MHDKLETRTFLMFLLIVSCAFLWLLKPFFGAIFWACAIAIIFHPAQKLILSHWPQRKNFAALATLLLCVVCVILPLTLVISSVFDEGMAFYNKLQSGEVEPAHYVELINNAFPDANSIFLKLGIDLNHIKRDAINAAITSSKFLAEHTLTIGQNAFGFVFSIVLMLYITFFMLRDGNTLVELLVRALPLGDARERTLFALFAEVTRATIKGTSVIAILQGSIGGITLWALEIHSSLMLGVLMAFASLIPVVGSAIIWLPIAIYLAAEGDMTSAIILSGVGVCIIAMLDNVLRPILVGRDTKMPDYLVLLSTLGGIGLFGMNGFVIGPLVAALFIAFWGIFIREVHVLAPENETNEADEKEKSTS